MTFQEARLKPVVAVRQATDTEMAAFGLTESWMSKPIIIELMGGLILFPLRDPEMNDSGVFLLEDPEFGFRFLVEEESGFRNTAQHGRPVGHIGTNHRDSLSLIGALYRRASYTELIFSKGRTEMTVSVWKDYEQNGPGHYELFQCN